MGGKWLNLSPAVEKPALKREMQDIGSTIVHHKIYINGRMITLANALGTNSWRVKKATGESVKKILVVFVAASSVFLPQRDFLQPVSAPVSCWSYNCAHVEIKQAKHRHRLI